jgi:hypothetical protein
LLVQLAHFGRQRLDLGVLGDVRRAPAVVAADVAQGAQLLNVVGVLIQAGRLVDDPAAPSRCSRFGDRGAAASARLGLAGLGQRSLTRLLVSGIAADTAAPIREDRVTRAILALVSHSATCGGRLAEIFGDLRSRTAWAGRKIVEFFGTHLQGSISTGKGFPPGGRPLPVVNSSTSRFLQREIIFFKGYSNFLCGGPKVPLPASQPPIHSVGPEKRAV